MCFVQKVMNPAIRAYWVGRYQRNASGFPFRQSHMSGHPLQETATNEPCNPGAMQEHDFVQYQEPTVRVGVKKPQDL